MLKVELELSAWGTIELEMLKGSYTNGRLAIMLMNVGSKEPFAVLTVNIPELHQQSHEFFVKTWAENEELTQALLKQTDLFVNTGRSIPTGFVQADIWHFSDPKTLDQMRSVS